MTTAPSNATGSVDLPDPPMPTQTSDKHVYRISDLFIFYPHSPSAKDTTKTAATKGPSKGHNESRGTAVFSVKYRRVATRTILLRTCKVFDGPSEREAGPISPDSVQVPLEILPRTVFHSPQFGAASRAGFSLLAFRY